MKEPNYPNKVLRIKYFLSSLQSPRGFFTLLQALLPSGLPPESRWTLLCQLLSSLDCQSLLLYWLPPPQSNIVINSSSLYLLFSLRLALTPLLSFTQNSLILQNPAQLLPFSLVHTRANCTDLVLRYLWFWSYRFAEILEFLVLLQTVHPECNHWLLLIFVAPEISSIWQFTGQWMFLRFNHMISHDLFLIQLFWS